MIGIQRINFLITDVFVMVLSVVFCDIFWTKKKVLAMAGSMIGILLFQDTIYFGIDPGIAEECYPLITHILFAAALCILNRKYLWPVISVLIACLCCQLRRFPAFLAGGILAGGLAVQNIAELAVTLPLLLVLIRFIGPAVRPVSRYPVLIQCQFGLVPAFYYGFDYLTRIYTDRFVRGGGICSYGMYDVFVQRYLSVFCGPHF